MDKQKNFSLQVLFLDLDRNPIKAQKYLLYFRGGVAQGVTGEDGMTRKIQTPSGNDDVQIAIERIDKSIKVISRVTSGPGKKLVTIVSPRVKLEGPTLAHPPLPPGQSPSTKQVTVPSHDPRKDQSPTTKTSFGLETELTKTTDGRPVANVMGDIPNLEFLGEYIGEVMSENDYISAASELNVEPAAIQAFAMVESEGSGFIQAGSQTVPKILYERHKFAKLTDNKYSKIHPDISLPCAYYNFKDYYVLADTERKLARKIPSDIEYYRPIGPKDDQATKQRSALFSDIVSEGKLIAQDHRYLNNLGSYRRLIKAYKLNPVAALESCSWGAFQIMGEFWRIMRYPSVQDFTRSMSRSPKDQLRAFVLYMKYVNPGIVEHLRRLDWEAVAFAYNGPKYKVNNYRRKFEAAYRRLKG